ncbi:MAG: fibronectin type III domain-containing protein [Bacteroidales bacterium]|nr:fibronectin type III domain-containing protein [Bacteroidales bacterium]
MKRFIHIVMTIMAVMAMNACGKIDGGNDEPGKDLSAPKNLTVTEAAQDALSFSWSEVEGAQSYKWKLTKNSSPVSSGECSQAGITINGLEAGIRYAFSVRAVSGDLSSSWTNLEVSTPAAGPEPLPGALCVDAPLVLTPEKTPVLGSSGLICVYKADGTLVDRIDMADIATVDILDDGTMIPKLQMNAHTVLNTFMDELHSNRYRPVHYTPIRINGQSVEIKLHNEALDFSSSYYLTADESAFGSAVGKGEFSFSTKTKPSGSTLKVAADGSGDFCTVQGALSFASTLGKDTEVSIEISSGTYKELLYLRDKNNLTIRGASRDGVVIIYPNSESYSAGSGASSPGKPTAGSAVGAMGGRGLALIESCNNLVIENLTIENSFWSGDHKGQAETIYFNSDGMRLTIGNCSLVSWQDTFLCKGEVWVHDSLIAGHCDFIWGYPKACLFENCEIRSRAGGYIVQARVNKASDKGFIFLNCRLTAESGVKDGSMYLARSGGDNSKYDNVVYVNCQMSPVIATSGWYSSPAPNPSKPIAAAGWREFGSVTPAGVSASGARNAFGLVLSASEAAPYSSFEAVLGW